MKNFINGIIKAGIEEWIGFIIITTLISLSALLVTSIAMPKKIECYYLYASTVDAYPVYKVYASTNWASDGTSFLSNDYTQALEVMSTLNQCGE